MLVGAVVATACSVAGAATEPVKVHVGLRAEFAVAAAGSLWTTDSVEDRVIRVDPETNRVVARIRTRGHSPLGITFGAGSIWVGNRNSGTVTRIAPKTNKARKPIRVGSGPYALAFGAGSVWVSNEASGTVSRINPKRNKVIKTIRVRGGPNGLVVALGSLWVADFAGGRVLRVNPATNRVTGRVALEHADWITPVGDALWVSSETNRVYRLDPATLTFTTSVAVGANPLASALIGDRLWVPNLDSNTVSVVDPASSAVERTVGVGTTPIAVAAAAGDAWVTSAADGDVWRLASGG